MDSIQRAHYDLNLLLPSSDNRYFTPEEIDSAINMAVTDLFNQQYKAFGETQRVSDQLARFKTTTAVPVSNGIAVAPPELIYTLNIFGSKIGTADVLKKVRIVEEQFINQYIDSEAFAPNEDNVVARLLGPNIQIYPTTITEIRVTYFRKPIVAKFAYTLSGVLQSVPTYDPINSVQIDYSDIAYNQILEKALVYLGVAQKDQTLMSQQNIFRQQNTPEAR